MLLLKVITGSRQHGFAGENSDFDVYEIYSSKEDFPSRSGKPENHVMENGVDLVQMTLSRFMERATYGSHQILDIMFAKNPEVDHITALRKGFIVSSYVYLKFIQVIIDLVYAGDMKKMRHALRIAYNLKELVETGQYVPELSPEIRGIILQVASGTVDEVKTHINSVSPYKIF